MRTDIIAFDEQETRNTIAILTLRRHEHGIWITRLVECLQQITKNAKPKRHVQVVVLEEYLEGPFCVSLPDPHVVPSSSFSSSSSWLGLVNRVSDAAEPWEVKACLAILYLAKSVWKIPIWNGPDAYSLCVNKWCHHILFAQAKLASPPTTAMLMMQQHQSQQPTFKTDTAPTTSTTSTADHESQITTTTSHHNRGEMQSLEVLYQMQNQQHAHPTNNNSNNNNNNEESHTTIQLEYLVKPNAGGFGAGIEKRQAHITTGTASTTSAMEHNDAGSSNHNNTLPNGPSVSAAAAAASDFNVTKHTTTPLPTFSDHMVLFQTYVKSTQIYRVWFLLGRVQSAVQRTTTGVNDDDNSMKPTSMASASTEFTSGCAGSGACTLRPPKAVIPSSSHVKSVPSSSSPTTAAATTKMEPWKVPACVRLEIEQQLLPVLPGDAHCGSVEFLYDDSSKPIEEDITTTTCSSDDEEHYHATRQRLYFDLNLLSTLPVLVSSSSVEQTNNEKTDQGPGDDVVVDPWRELANAICHFMFP